MACPAIHSWTFSSLVAAFLDLFIAYFLLSASSLVYFTSKFLSIFGLYLPCPSDGLFSDPNRSYCYQTLLIDHPIQKISSVQLSTKSKFPFDSIFLRNHQTHHLNLIKDDGFFGIEPEASCSSSSDARVHTKNELVPFDDFKGKGVFTPRPKPTTLRRRRRAAMVSRRETSLPPRGQSVEDEESSARAGNSEYNSGIQSDEGAQHTFQWNGLSGESKNYERDESSASDMVPKVDFEIGSDRGEVNAVRVLEQALEEEHAARVGLYRELEKERSAAASAADEAMAMILRLQKEKAATEMEAKQYQRMIEEKSAYDAEEMNILKEILIRREREKHFLEKEVEVYREILTNSGNEDLLANSLQRPRMSIDSSDDPSLILQQISEYIDKKEMIKNINLGPNFDASAVERQGRVLTYGGDSPSLNRPEIGDLLQRGDSWRGPSNENYNFHGYKSSDECEQEFQEKRLLSMDKHPSDANSQWLEAEADSSFHKLNKSPEQNSVEKTIVVDGEQGKNGISFSHNDANLDKPGNDADQNQSNLNSSYGAGPTLHDVHVIDDKSEFSNQGSERLSESLLMDNVRDRYTKSDLESETSSLRSVDIFSNNPSTSREKTQSSIRRSMSDMKSVSDKSKNKALFSDMRRNSASSVSYERLKLENEVGWLTERLKIVQEGREKLSFSVEHRERERLHLQLLEGIASQLREIRQLTEPGKAVRQASLPPLSSKVGSKKRRCRSISIHGSSS